MLTLEEIEKLALQLSEEERGKLAALLLESLPPLLMDDDDGITEALRRDAEMRADPSIAISLEEFDRRIRSRFKPLPKPK